jgi:TRAP-type mannitol/chloroaromatic compound transport system substrate-binding protein
MKRRRFLAAAAGSAAAASAFPTPAISQGIRELKLVMPWPRNSPALGTSAQRIADQIGTLSGGKLRVKVFGAGELVPAFQAFDAVSKGDADLYHGAEYYWQGKSKAFNFFTAVPFGLTGTEMHAWLEFGGGQQLWDELSANFNIKGFSIASTGTQMAGWFRKPITSLDDFKGLKMRIPGLGGEVLRHLGVTVVNLPVGEIFPALQSGAIDAAEWVAPWQDLAFGFHKIVKHYHSPGFHEPGTVGSLGVNKKLYDSLTAEQKLIIEVVTRSDAKRQEAENNVRNMESLDVLVAKHGVQLRRFSDEILARMAKVSEEVVGEIGRSDPFTRKVYDSYLAHRKRAMAWAEIGERAFLNARAAHLG